MLILMLLNKYIKFTTLIFVFLFSLIFSNESKLPQTFLKDLDNKKVDIYQFLDDGPMLINFWFLACEPCKKEMKYLDIYNKKYNKYGFKVVSVNTDNSRTFSRVKPFVNSKKYSFKVLSDPKSSFFRKLGGQQCPYAVLFDQEGNVINKHIGYNPGDEIKLEKEIISVLSNRISSDTTKVDSSIIILLEQIKKDAILESKSE